MLECGGLAPGSAGVIETGIDIAPRRFFRNGYFFILLSHLTGKKFDGHLQDSLLKAHDSIAENIKKTRCRCQLSGKEVTNSPFEISGESMVASLSISQALKSQVIPVLFGKTSKASFRRTPTISPEALLSGTCWRSIAMPKPIIKIAMESQLVRLEDILAMP